MTPLALLLLLSSPAVAAAEEPAPLVTAPKAAEIPAFEKPKDEGTTVTLSAGGSWATGNTRSLQGTINGQLETRSGDNAIATHVLGNYGQAGRPDMTVAAQNIQGRLRYDRFLTDGMSVFMMTTGRHDRFQGIDFRLNLDPGVRYLVVRESAYALWGEAGYDLQHDVRRRADTIVYEDPETRLLPRVDPATRDVIRVPRTYTDHAGRLFVGYRHAFNKEVTLQTGLEYLQSLRDPDRYRMNLDALAAAKLTRGFSLGMSLGARYDHAPLAGKDRLDTLMTANLIYAFSTVAEPTPVCPQPVGNP